MTSFRGRGADESAFGTDGDGDGDGDVDGALPPLPPPMPLPPPIPVPVPREGAAAPSSSPSHVSPRSSAAQRKQLTNSAGLTADQMAIVLADLADQSSPTLVGGFAGDTTWSRYLVENHLSDYKWYHPLRDDAKEEKAPDLKKGWAYFEHFTLPRRFATKTGGKLQRAPPGSGGAGGGGGAQRRGGREETRLYSVWGTPMESLSDWGIGMSMYFSSIAAATVIFLLVGCVNVANIMYYSSPEYDPGVGTRLLDRVKLLQYSAVCTDREWVVCSEGCDTDAAKEYWDSKYFDEMYYATAKDAAGQNVTLINRTTCDPAQFQQGMINYGTLMLLIVSMSLYMWYLSKLETRFDEDNSSPTDYTIAILNPPPEAIDPDEWRDFFGRFSDKGVVLVTVALDNEPLLTKLVQRRTDIKALKRRFRPGVVFDFDDENSIVVAVENARRDREGEDGRRNCLSRLFHCLFDPFGRCLGLAPATEGEIWKRIKDATKEIKELQQKEYHAAAVFVTFETEEGQRTALEALNASEWEVTTNTVVHLEPSVLFRGQVLRVNEASEPDTVRWRDLHYRRKHIYLRLFGTFAITFGLVALSAFILQLSRLRVDTILFSVILSTFNSIIPMVVRVLCAYEKHYDEGGLQVSLYVKITFFRWVNTAIVTRVITPFLVTLGDRSIDLINTINALMISEMIVSPLLRYLDVFTILNRHFFAPRAKTEEELFDCFGGGWYNLAERFTDFTKVLLLCTFYSAFYPLIYFLGALILFGQYWMDKFLLLKSWQKAPMVGTKTAKLSRTYFNPLAILLGAISSAYAYASSPFTQLCSCSENGKECYVPNTQVFSDVILRNGENIGSVETGNEGEGYYFCDQHDLEYFPPTTAVQGENRWMTEGQESLVTIYGWTCVVLLILYCVVVLGQRAVSALKSLVKGVHRPTGLDQHKDFSSGIGMESFGYIPQLEVPGVSHFPMLVCDIDDIDVNLIGWKDPNVKNSSDPHRNYDDHNLIFDVPHETLRRSRHEANENGSSPNRGRKNRPIFSVIRHYPPEWVRKTSHDTH